MAQWGHVEAIGKVNLHVLVALRARRAGVNKTHSPFPIAGRTLQGETR